MIKEDAEMNELDAEEYEEQLDVMGLKERYEHCILDLERCQKEIKSLGKISSANKKLYSETTTLVKTQQIHVSVSK